MCSLGHVTTDSILLGALNFADILNALIYCVLKPVQQKIPTILSKLCQFGDTRNLSKAIQRATQAAVEGNTWKKFVDPTAIRGKTVFPKGQADQERLGVRWDYDGEVTKADGVYHKFQMQPNAGKVPSSIEDWKRKHGGTHAVMATALVKKDGSKDDVKQGLEKAAKDVKP